MGLAQSRELFLSQIGGKLALPERKLILRAGDAIAISSGIFYSLWLFTQELKHGWSWNLSFQQSFCLFPLLVGWCLWIFLHNLHKLSIAVRVGHTLKNIALGTVCLSILCPIDYWIGSTVALKTVPLSGGILPGIGVAVTSILLIIWRATFGLVFALGHTRERLLIIGAGVSGKIISEVLLLHPDYQTIGFIDDNRELYGRNCHNLPILGDRQRIVPEIERREIDRIILAITQPIDDELLQILSACHERGIEVIPMPIFYEELTGKIAVEHIGSQWYSALPLKKKGFDTFNRISKRLLDVVCGLILASIFAILFPWIAIAIKLDSPGSIFYGQERVGKYGKKFTVYKFRSMVENAEADGKAQWAVKGDARITRVGQFLRKTRLDELPQVINVLRGEMSMVGPRPEREQFIDRLQEQIPFYRTRLAVKPGLTGWAQVNYGYGSTVKDALIKLQYDLYYHKHWSPWLDIKIMLRTFGVVFKMQGQ